LSIVFLQGNTSITFNKCGAAVGFLATKCFLLAVVGKVSPNAKTHSFHATDAKLSADI
jgi:hypothetical protein